MPRSMTEDFSGPVGLQLCLEGEVGRRQEVGKEARAWMDEDVSCAGLFGRQKGRNTKALFKKQ